jgi:hypothetical protein
VSNGPSTAARTHIGAREARDAMPRALEVADAAAARGDHAEALAWLQTLEAIGHRQDSVSEEKRARWRLKLEDDRTGCSQWFG